MELGSRDRHDLGYWMSIFGFAVVVFVGMFYGVLSLDADSALVIVGAGFVVFLIGAELALRNQRHLKKDED